jgi:hypothetical protein
MRRPLTPIPLEFVLSEMLIVDDKGGVSNGAIVCPRFEGDKDDKFKGEQGTLKIAIHKSTTTRLAAYEEAIAYFEALRKRELLYNELKKTGSRRKKKRHN